jgi:hypothetical protein
MAAGCLLPDGRTKWLIPADLIEVDGEMFKWVELEATTLGENTKWRHLYEHAS